MYRFKTPGFFLHYYHFTNYWRISVIGIVSPIRNIHYNDYFSYNAINVHVYLHSSHKFGSNQILVKTSNFTGLKKYEFTRFYCISNLKDIQGFRKKYALFDYQKVFIAMFPFIEQNWILIAKYFKTTNKQLKNCMKFSYEVLSVLSSLLTFLKYGCMTGKPSGVTQSTDLKAEMWLASCINQS